MSTDDDRHQDKQRAGGHAEVHAEAHEGAHAGRPGGDLGRLQQALLRFRDERDWAQFHTLKNLAASVSIEAGELLELTQWKSDAELAAAAREPAFRARLEDECADVLHYLLLLADAGGIDLLAAAEAKLARNAQRYPVELARGTARRHDALRTGAQDAPHDG